MLTLHWHHTPLGVGQGQNVGLRDFCHNWTLLPPGASVFHKHMSSLVIESLTRICEKCLKGLLSLVGYLVHLRHSWQNGENDKGPSMGIKRFEYRKFPLSGKWNCTQFCKITTGHGNTIQNLANMMVFCLYGILFLYMPKHGLFLFQKRLFNYLVSKHRFTWFWSHAHTIGWGLGLLNGSRLFNYLVTPFYLVLITCSHYRLGSGTS